MDYTTFEADVRLLTDKIHNNLNITKTAHSSGRKAFTRKDAHLILNHFDIDVEMDNNISNQTEIRFLNHWHQTENFTGKNPMEALYSFYTKYNYMFSNL